jgi:bifunctional DNase/RNase
MGRAASSLLLGLAAFCAVAGCRRTTAAEAGTVEVRVQTVALDDRSQSPVVVLEERAGSRRLPIWIGAAEASSIVNQLHKVESIRPNTHDLAKRLIDGLEGNVARVVVTDLAGGIYYARIVLTRAGGSVEIDARPSDAIAIALRFEAPLFVEERLFEKALEATGGEGGHRI